MHPVIRGGYNVIYRLEYEDGSSAIMRVPIKGLSPFPDEKILYEVATMRYVAANTTIPVSKVYHHGSAADNPTGLGPFIIMEWIEHHQNMSRVLLDPERPLNERPILNPSISEGKLEILYGQMADILLQLMSLKFSCIGSLVEDQDNNTISVSGRPLTANMADIVVHTNAPPSILPTQVYTTTNDWFGALADMHMTQLAFQQHDAVEDEDDARDKFIARQLFRKIIAEGRIIPSGSSPSEGFRLFSEDFRPANVLLDKDLRVVGVIDWEFAYAAPAQFSFDPPWWLLLQEPEHWRGGYHPWMETYEPRLRTFLRVLEVEEKKMEKARVADENHHLAIIGTEDPEAPLSQRMRESWEQRTWMINYAARKSWAFDFIWWKFLDEKHFGPNDEQDYHARLGLFSEPQKAIMEALVCQKMEEAKNSETIRTTEQEAVILLTQLLV